MTKDGDSPGGAPRKKMRYSTDEGPDITSAPIKIIVGTNPSRDFYVHEGLLRSSSRFFDNTLKHDWKEGQKRTVRLPGGATVEYFKIWVKWLYAGRLFLTEEDDVVLADGEPTASAEWPRWAHCYSIGDYLQDPDFKDAAMDTMIEALMTRERYPC